MKIKDSQIRTRENPQCAICGTKGEILYEYLRDRLFGAPGEWNLNKCANPNCGLLWLNPMPVEEDLSKAYSTYYTHQDPGIPAPTPLRRAYRRMKAGYLAGKYGYELHTISPLFKFLGVLFYLSPGRRAKLDASVFYLPALSEGRLLEVGCGRGATLKEMADLGWRVEGVDFDANSVRNARSKGLTVHHGDLIGQKYEDNIFDAIVMSHVIEHVPNPLEVLQESFRVLKPGGTLVVLTPNTSSLGHWMYGSNWRGLEPPRHLHLFNSMSLTQLASLANFDDVSCRSSVRAKKIFLQSRICAREGNIDLEKGVSITLRVWAEMMELLESIIKVFFSNVGEELKLIGKKNA
jgi:2-polyprenyl-3-methyl-5-hydroxy-6-metoxy-1,4-benzoquinol methylase